MSGDASAHLADAERCLARWDVAGCRAAAERARSLAGAHGESATERIAEMVAMRATLLITPTGLTVPSLARATPAVAAAATRLSIELTVARGETPDVPSLIAGAPVDLEAAVVIASVARVAAGERATRATRADGAQEGSPWRTLLAALDREASGGSGWQDCGRALAIADDRDDRALGWVALELRHALAMRRGASGEAASTRAEMRGRLERFLLTLAPNDANAARARADRAFLRAEEGAVVASVLVDLALALAHEHDPAKLSDLALDAVVRETQAERGVLFLSGEAGAPTVAARRFVDDDAEARGLIGVSRSVAARALATGDAFACDDVRNDRDLGAHESLARDVRSLLAVPIRARGNVEGAIYLDRRANGRPFDASAITAASAMGGILASALLSARVVRDLEARTKELDAARAELADALATRTVQRDDAVRLLADARGGVTSGRSLLVGRGPAMLKLLAAIRRVAGSDAPVLIGGETGTGKELVARAIHDASARRDRPFVAVNCGALSETLLEAELFGVEKGAYTGANASRPGLFVAAHGGTLLLDEVGDMPPAMQVAMLRVLETGDVRPVGGGSSRRVDVRVIAASHKNLADEVDKGAFRADLRYRLEVIAIDVPPLRERIEDLPELCEHLLADVRTRYGLPARRLSRDALRALALRAFPGNVRELRHVLASAALAASDTSIEVADLPAARGVTTSSESTPAPSVEAEDGHVARADGIRRALRATAGHRGRAAQLLGVSRSTLYRYLETYRIDPKTFGPPDDEGDDA